MKKIFSFLILTVITISLNAQNRTSNSINFSEFQTGKSRSINDTLFPYSFIDTSSGGIGCLSVVYAVDINFPLDSGYVTGTNIYNDLEKGQRYNISDYGFDSVLIDKVIIQFGIIHPYDTAGFVTAKIYRLNSFGFPDSLLRISDSLSVTDLVLNVNGMAEFNFDLPIVCTNFFTVSVDFTNCQQDTIAVIHTIQNCYETTGSSFEKWSDFSWHEIKNSWQFETDLAIFPVLSNGVLITAEMISNINKTSFYPNPVSDLLNIFNASKASEFSIYNLTGRKIIQQKVNEPNNFQLDFSEYPNGIYFIKLSEIDFEIMKMIVVQH